MLREEENKITRQFPNFLKSHYNWHYDEILSSVIYFYSVAYYIFLVMQ